MAPGVTLSYEDAVAQITAPGERYETTEVEVGGVTYTAFKGAPATLKDLFDLTRLYDATEYLVYEDERYTFAEVYARADGIAAALVDTLRRRQGRPGRHRHAQLPRVDRRLPRPPLSIGAVVVSINAWWTADELEYGLEDSGATVLVADDERVERSRGAAAARSASARSACGSRTPTADGRRPLGGRASTVGRRRPERRHRPRRRRHHPLHVGHDRAPEGRGLHPPGRHPGAHGLRLPSARSTRCAGPTKPPAAPAPPSSS